MSQHPKTSNTLKTKKHNKDKWNQYHPLDTCLKYTIQKVQWLYLRTTLMISDQYVSLGCYDKVEKHKFRRKIWRRCNLQLCNIFKLISVRYILTLTLYEVKSINKNNIKRCMLDLLYKNHAEMNRQICEGKACSCTKYPRPVILLNRADASWSSKTDNVLK